MTQDSENESENKIVTNGLGEIVWREETWPLERLKKYDRNPRKITDKQKRTLEAAIKKLGFHTPICCQPDGTVISGHQRLDALHILGKTEVRVSLPSRVLNEDEFKQMVVQCNISAGSFDIPMLMMDYEEHEMEEWGADDVTLKHFRKKDIPLHADDETPIASVAVSKVGDIWILGPHRLGCGDSTNPAHVDKLLAGVVPHLMVTDPPYGVEYDASWRNNVIRADGSRVGARAVGKVENDDRSDWRQAWALFPGEAAYVWHGGLHAANVAESLEACGFDIRAQIIWAKNQIAIGRGHYHWKHEPCWYAVRKGGTGHWQGDRTQSTLWDIDKPQKSETGHSTQKPVECMKRPIENNSAAGDAIYEPFSGSGTTIIAGEITGRPVFAMELNPLYVDLTARRWQTFTGRKAINEATGDPFPG